MEKSNTHKNGKKNVRETAVLILSTPQKTAQFALNEFFQKNSLADSDKALLTELVYGTLRREISLRWLLSKHLPHPEKLPPQMLQRLEIATYEIFCLDKIPIYASVDTAVADIRQAFGKNLAGVANAVLRNIARMPEEEKNLTSLLQHLTQDFTHKKHKTLLDPLARLEIVSGVPLWILQLWNNSYGQEATEQLAFAAQEKPLSALRINKSRPQWKDLLGNFAPYAASPNAKFSKMFFEKSVHREKQNILDEQQKVIGFAGLCFAPENVPPEIHAQIQEAFIRGESSWQGVGSQLILSNLLSEDTPEKSRNTLFWFTQKDAIAKQSAENISQPILDSSFFQGSIWDACAGYGGKALAMLELGLPLQCASDINLPRLRGLCREAKRLHLTLPEIFCSSASQQPFFPDQRFDTILLDAPCSGLGTLARHPDLRRLRQPEHLNGLIETQKKLLDTCWNRLNPHGRLLYITCTVNSAENEEQIVAFLKKTPDAQLVRQEYTMPLFDGADFMYGAILSKVGRKIPAIEANSTLAEAECCFVKKSVSRETISSF